MRYFFESLWSLNWRRRRLLKKALPEPLRAYYAIPFADRRLDWSRHEYVALDFETTGLDARNNEILSVGLVVIKDATVHLHAARHWLVRPSGLIPAESAVVHGIFNDQLECAFDLELILPQLLMLLAGKVLVAHHAAIEIGFLDAACRRLYGYGFLMPAIDTLDLELRRLTRLHQPVPAEGLRLDVLRARYHLPRYTAHHALSDALAAGELFLAQLAHFTLDGPLPLKRLLHRQYR